MEKLSYQAETNEILKEILKELKKNNSVQHSVKVADNVYRSVQTMK